MPPENAATSAVRPCNTLYDKSRSADVQRRTRSAVAANLVMCGIGEEPGPPRATRLANNSLDGHVATHSARVRPRGAVIPASLTRDRAGVLGRKASRNAPRMLTSLRLRSEMMRTADSMGRMPGPAPMNLSAETRIWQGVRHRRVLREFMQVFTKADEDRRPHRNNGTLE